MEISFKDNLKRKEKRDLFITKKQQGKVRYEQPDPRREASVSSMEGAEVGAFGS